MRFGARWRVVGLVCMCGSPVLGTDLTTVHLNPDSCHLFATFAPESAEFLGLTPDGRYVNLDRQHMGVRVSDRGTWSQDQAGVVTLTSDELYRNAEFGRLTIFLAHDGAGKKWAAVTEALERFLASEQGATFPAEAVERIYNEQAPCCPDVVLTGINVHDTDDVKRSELEGLLATLEGYPSLKDSRAFHLVPLVHRDRVFLEWQDARTPINRDRTRMAGDLENLQPGSAFPWFFFVGIDFQRFVTEAARLQPFVHYTEMNDVLKERALPADVVTELRRIMRSCQEPPELSPSPSPSLAR